MSTTILTNLILGITVFTTLILLLSVIVIRLRAILLPSRAVELRVNQRPAVQVSSGRKLLETLCDQGIPIPSACAGAGTCGLCKVAVTDGAGVILPTEASRLTRMDRQQHMRLACQVKIRQNITVNVPSHMLHAESWRTTVSSVHQLSPLIREIVLTLPGQDKLNFRPGGYVQVTSTPYALSYADFEVDPQHLTGWNKLGVNTLRVSSKESVTRAYSLANKPSDQTQIVLLVRLALPPPAAKQSVLPGIVSSWLFSLQVGDRVDVAGPYGDFTLHENEREMVLIGGGVGMAPLRSLIHHELASTRVRPVSFYFGARSQSDIFYAHEFDNLQKEYDRFHWVTALSESDVSEPWTGPTGFIHDVFRQKFLDMHVHPERCDYYLCGPPLMQQAVINVLEDAGVDLATVYADIFN